MDKLGNGYVSFYENSSYNSHYKLFIKCTDLHEYIIVLV